MHFCMDEIPKESHINCEKASIVDSVTIVKTLSLLAVVRDASLLNILYMIATF